MTASGGEAQRRPITAGLLAAILAVGHHPTPLVERMMQMHQFGGERAP